MHNISDKDKKIWNFYISNLRSIKKVDKNKKINSSTISNISKVLKPNVTFTLDSKIKKQIKSNRLNFDAIIDLHGKTEVQAHELITNFIKRNCFSQKEIFILYILSVNRKTNMLWIRWIK